MKKPSEEAQIATIAADVKNLVRGFEEFKREIRNEIKSLKNTYVTKAEFQPVRNIAYGFVGTVLLAVVGAVITLVIK